MGSRTCRRRLRTRHLHVLTPSQGSLQVQQASLSPHFLARGDPDDDWKALLTASKDAVDTAPRLESLPKQRSEPELVEKEPEPYGRLGLPMG